MNLDYFAYILRTNECGSIRKAAEELYMRQQNLSSIIKKVEHHYGITIFKRGTKGVTPTPDGEYFLERAKKILATADELEKSYLYPSKRYYANVVDQITLFNPDMLSSGRYLSVIKSFNQLFPYVKIHIQSIPADKPLEELINDNRTIVTQLRPFFADDLSQSLPAAFRSAQLPISMHFAAATRQDNPEALRLSQISAQDLLAKELIIRSSGALEDNIFYKLLCHYGEPNISYVLDNVSLFTDLMASGNYWSIAQSAVEGQFGLHLVPIQEDFYATVHLIFRDDATDNFILQTFIQLLSERE